MSRIQAHRLITSAETVEALPIGNKKSITTESQARELSRVEPEKRQEVVERVSVATGGKITATARPSLQSRSKIVLGTVGCITSKPFS